MDRSKPCAKCRRLIYANAWHTCPNEACYYHLPCAAAPPPPAEQASGDAVKLLRAFQTHFGACRPDDPDDRETWDQIDAAIATLSQRPAVEGWSLCIRQSERDKKPAVWATDGSSYVWVADLAPQQPTGEEE